jgi:hypothetical protein
LPIAKKKKGKVWLFKKDLKGRFCLFKKGKVGAYSPKHLDPEMALSPTGLTGCHSGGSATATSDAWMKWEAVNDLKREGLPIAETSGHRNGFKMDLWREGLPIGKKKKGKVCLFKKDLKGRFCLF